MRSCDAINSLLGGGEGKHYLEIGVGSAINFNEVECKYKMGVDPEWINSDCADERFYIGTSDEYFRDCKKMTWKKFDVVYIDGDHSYCVSCRDMVRSFSVLKPGGRIVVHGCLPRTPSQACSFRPRGENLWCGEVWRNWMWFRKMINIRTFCIPSDCGIGVISKGKNDNPYTGRLDLTACDYLGLASINKGLVPESHFRRTSNAC